MTMVMQPLIRRADRDGEGDDKVDVITAGHARVPEDAGTVAVWAANRSSAANRTKSDAGPERGCLRPADCGPGIVCMPIRHSRVFGFDFLRSYASQERLTEQCSSGGFSHGH